MPEVNSRAALALRSKFKPPLVLTELHRLELSTAWHLKVFRKEMPLVAATQADDDLQADIDAGIWLPPELELRAVFAAAQRLCRVHAPKLGVRTLDTLHVAAALELGAKQFITGDARQAAVATAVALAVTRL